MNPTVSVIIPAYRGTYLREAIDSALAQTVPPLEVLVIDDGSPDDLSWVTRDYAGRVIYLRKPNGGPASARNLGVDRSRGEYLAFLDADDVWEPEKIEAQLAECEQDPDIGLVYSAFTRVDAAGKRHPHRRRRSGYSGYIFNHLFMKNFILTSTVMVRKCCFDDVGLSFDETRELISVEDYHLWLRIAERFKVAYVDRPLTRYRLHSSGISRNVARSYFGEQRVIERSVARNASTNPFIPQALKRRLAQLSFECGHEYFSMSRYPEARTQFLRSLAYRPFSLRAWVYLVATGLGRSGAEALRRIKRIVTRVPASAEPVPEGRMRLMHVLFSLNTGGAEHVVLNLARRMSPERYELHVCSLSGEGELAPEFRRLGVRVHALRKKPGVDLALCVTLARLFRREHIQLVHTHNVAPWLYAGIAAKFTGAKLYHTEHSNVFAHKQALLVAERVLASFTRVIIADSDKVKRHLVERQGIAARRVITIVNGIDTEAFGHDVDKTVKRRELGLNGASPVIGTVGRLAPVKDQKTLLEAFRQVVGVYPKALLLIVGDGPMRQDLEAQAQAFGLSSHVKFLGRRADIPELLPLFDIFVLSSVSEGLPLTVLEAMAAGIPVVATNVGGLCEVVTDRETGLLVPPQAPTQLAQAMATLLDDHALRAAIRHAARRRVKTQFDLTRMVEGYETAYHHESLS